MAERISYFIGGSTFRCHDAAIILDGEDPLEQLIESVIQTISTEVMVTVGEVTMHLAAWQDPDHWSDDWAEKGIDPDDVHGLVAAAQTPAQPLKGV